MAREKAAVVWSEISKAQGLSAVSLEKSIRTIPDFPKAGIQFRDITTLLANGKGLASSIDGLADLAEGLGAEAVAGVEARGFIFGTALALRLGVGFIPLRKAGKLPVPTLSEDYALEYGSATLEIDPSIVDDGQRVLLVDDLLATGGTAIAGGNLLRRAGAVCDDALFVVNLPDLGGVRALSDYKITANSLISFKGE